MRIRWAALFCCTVVAVAAAEVFMRNDVASAQDAKSAAQGNEPKTKLEAFDARSGAVVVRGFSRVGSVSGAYGTAVAIECKEYLDAASGKKEYGISVEVTKTESYGKRDSTSYIDYDEIDSLLKGIDYIAKIDMSVTKLANFQADYSTKGDLNVSTYSMSGQVQAGVRSGRIGGVLAFLKLSDLVDFRNLVAKAKDALDDLRR